ncbi:MAG: MBL fold metallo-hydrolase [Acutalibacteraceae bacterium]|jgi:hydroxyacylglutathione hydrolase|nr:MBL fold metallo-hydrolase [Acutalibacteraceae bacterium]
MRYLCITDGMLAENCYLLLDEASGEAAVIDPGFVNDRLLGEIAKYKVRWILLTHGHFDHIEGVDRLRALTGAPSAAFRTEGAFAADPAQNGSLLMFGRPIACTVDRLLEDGETIHVGAVPVQVLHTPGHTAGGCCYVTPEAVFTGDTLMGYSVGRCDLPTGDEAALAVSLQKLAALPGDPAICGGHGPVTRLSEEKRRNPYL